MRTSSERFAVRPFRCETADAVRPASPVRRFGLLVSGGRR